MIFSFFFFFLKIYVMPVSCLFIPSTFRYYFVRYVATVIQKINVWLAVTDRDQLMWHQKSTFPDCHRQRTWSFFKVKSSVYVRLFNWNRSDYRTFNCIIANKKPCFVIYLTFDYKWLKPIFQGAPRCPFLDDKLLFAKHHFTEPEVCELWGSGKSTFECIFPNFNSEILVSIMK